MGWDEIKRSWNKLKGEVKREWSKLTDEDVELIKGKYTELLDLLQERYGHAKEQAEGFVTLAGFTCLYCLPGESQTKRFQCLSLASPRSKTASTCSV